MNDVKPFSFSEKELRRFHDKFIPDPNTGCWHWVASVNSRGYAQFSLKGQMCRAHRYSWAHHNNQDIPDGMEVCHSCDERSCVNPDHLFIGTHADNMEDAAAKNRMPKGSKNKNAKLTERDVLNIRKFLQNGETNRTIAKRYPVSEMTISAIKHRKKWRHI